MSIENFVKLQPVSRFLGLQLPGDGKIRLQWTTDQSAPGQTPSNAYEMLIPESEAWRMMTYLAMAYDQRGRPPIPQD